MSKSIVTITDLKSVVEESGVEPQTASMLQTAFVPFFQKAAEWREKAYEIKVTSADQKTAMGMARLARLDLRAIRLESEKKRKAMKEDSLRYGKAVDGMQRILEMLIVPIENYLEEQEQFVQIQASRERAERKQLRDWELAPFSAFAPAGVDVSNLTDEDFALLLNAAKSAMDAKNAADLRAEAERKEREEAEAAERERVRIENEALRAEAAKREAEIKKQQEEAAAEKRRLEAEISTARAQQQAIEAAERKREADEKARIEAEKAAPDKEKLAAYAAQIESLIANAPEVNTSESVISLGNALKQMRDAVKFLRLSE